MKKLTITFMAVLLAGLMVSTVFAQETQETPVPKKESRYNLSIMFQPLPMVLFPAFSTVNLNVTLQYAAGIGNVGTSIGYTFGNSTTTNLGFAIEGSLFDLDVFYRIVPIINPLKGPLDGFYIGPGVRYENFTLADSSSIIKAGPFVDIGYQWVNNNFAVDLNIGGGYYLYNSMPELVLPIFDTRYYFRFMFELGFAI